MAITFSTDSPANIAAALKEGGGAKPKYLVVYASTDDNGRSWCGDCRDAEPFINTKFGAKSELDVTVVYAGQRAEWRTPQNPWRQEPFAITALPTLVKVVNGKWERLVEADVYDQVKLDSFVVEESGN